MSQNRIQRRGRSAFAGLLCLGVATLAFAQAPARSEGPGSDSPAGEEQEPPTPPARPVGGAPPSNDALKMGSPPQLAEGLTEEDMWPAATAEGWKQPCLIHWQRTFEDALRVAQAENRPILVAVNMDGEIASEHFAGVRYREAATADEMSKYVCVLASVYRHTPRDYDEQGQRVECPRFGTVTCGEHIEAERELYDKYFDGTRTSPRHIVLEPDGTETYDVYFSWDTQSVFTTFAKGLEGRPDPNPDMELSIDGLTQSAKVQDRERLEAAYATGDAEVRRTVLRLLIDEHTVDQVEVLRAAIFGLDLELASLAREALAKCETEGALDLMAETLKSPISDSERAMLLDAVARIGKHSKRARTLSALHQGLPVDSRYIDASKLLSVEREYEVNSAARTDVAALEDAAETSSERASALLDLAEALLARAQTDPHNSFVELWTRDALATAKDAESKGASGPRVDAVIAVTADWLGDREEGRRRAIRAVESGLLLAADPSSPAGSLTPTTGKRVLRLFAEARRRAIFQAYRNGDEWPPEWLSDVNGAYAVLMQDPLADASIFIELYDFLNWIGATQRSNEVLDLAFRNFPDAPDLHQRLRARLLWEGGADSLTAEYAKRLEQIDADSTQIAWFAGYAALIAAEHEQRRSKFELARQHYDESIALFERNAERFPENRDSCDHYIALSQAALARLALQSGDLITASDLLLSAIQRRPNSSATQDGLGITPIATAKMLKARLLESDEPQRAEAIQSALDQLDPVLLEPPVNEPRNLRRRR